MGRSSLPSRSSTILELYHPANFHIDLSWGKRHIILIGGCPGVTVPRSLYTFRKLLSSCDAATYRLRDIRFFRKPKLWILGSLGYNPQKGRRHPGPICTIMQNFTPIGATVAEISVTEHSKKIANLVPCHTNVWRTYDRKYILMLRHSSVTGQNH